MQTPISCQVLQKHFCCDVARLLARHCSRLAVEPRSLPPSNIITIFAFLFLLQTKLYSPTLFLLFDNSQTAKWGIFKNICVKQQRKASQPIKQFMNRSDYVLKTQCWAFFSIYKSKWQKFPQNYPETWSMIWSPVSVRKSQTSLQHTFMKTLWCGNFSWYTLLDISRAKNTLFIFYFQYFLWVLKLHIPLQNVRHH